MNTAKINIETIIKKGLRTYLDKGEFLFTNKHMILVALIGRKERLKKRGVRGTKIHWFWDAYHITSVKSYHEICDFISCENNRRIVFMFVQAKYVNTLKYSGTMTLEVVNSLDEAETTNNLLEKLRGKIYCE